MNLLQMILGSVLGGAGKKGGVNLDMGQLTKLVPAVLNLVNSIGLPKLIKMFDDAGLDDVIKSWIGKAANKAISGEQVTQALGSSTIGSLAKQIGAPKADTAGALAAYLPKIIDALTPDGKPDEARVQEAANDGGSGLDLGDLMGMVGSLMKKK